MTPQDNLSQFSQAQPPSLRRRVWQCVGFWLLSAVVCVMSHAAEAIKRSFDLPADSIEKSLKRFSSQSGLEVLFPTDAVAGGRTQPVRGVMTSRAAIDAMLRGTGYAVFQDPRSGALTVRRERTVPGVNDAASKKKPAGSPADPVSMKKGNFLTRMVAAVALLVAPASGAENGGTITGRVSNVATGNFLNNARVAIKGTEHVAFTDASGTYRLVGVRAGNVVLEVFYTDLDPQAIPVQVTAGGSVERNVELTSRSRYGAGEVLTLDAFTVSSDKEADNQAVALNEQRFAPNIKNVMAADSFGDVLGSSVGEFLKFLPGVALEEDGNEVQGVSIRGAGGARTAYMTDGQPLATANDGASRNVDLVMLALDSISRLEVTKVPTPSMPADSLAGAVNMVSKSAFERSKPQFNYGISLIGNGEHLTLRKTPQSNGDRRDFKTRPGANFSLVLPIRKTFGIVVSGVHSDKYSDTAIATKVFNAAGTQTGASIAQPFLQQFTLNHSPKNLTRTSFTFKADWR